MDVRRTYVTVNGWEITATDEYEPAAVIVDAPTEPLEIDDLDDLLVALQAAKDDLKFLLAKQEHEKTANAQSEEKKK